MCAGIMLLKIHLGLETRKTAKATIARRFLDTYYKFFEKQDHNNAKPQLLSPNSVERDMQCSKGKLPTTDMAPILTGSQWLNANSPEVSTTLKLPDNV